MGEEKRRTEGEKNNTNFLQSHNLLLTDGSLSPDSWPSPIARRGECVIVEHKYIPESLVQHYCEQVQE